MNDPTTASSPSGTLAEIARILVDHAEEELAASSLRPSTQSES